MRFIILWLFVFSSGKVLGQDDPYLTRLLSTYGKMCTQELVPAQLFSRELSSPDDIWNSGSVLKVRAVGVCRRTEDLSYTDEVSIGESYMDVTYRANCDVSKILNRFYEVLTDDKKDWNSSFGMFCKPGKIFCLSNDKLTIRVVSMNSCSDMKAFDKLIKFYRALDKYDAVLVVKCGVDPRHIELFRKKK